MMNLKNRTALFLLAILTVSLAATACSDASDKGNENTDVKGTGTAGMETEAVSEPSEEDVRRAVSDNIPELDFNGTHFRSMTQDSTSTISGSKQKPAMFWTTPFTIATAR